MHRRARALPLCVTCTGGVAERPRAFAVGWRNCFAAAEEAEAGKQHMLKLKADADRAAKATGSLRKK